MADKKGAEKLKFVEKKWYFEKVLVLAIFLTTSTLEMK
jgi:hypothetical protein